MKANAPGTPVLEIDERVIWAVLRGRRAPLSLSKLSGCTKFPANQIVGILINLINYGYPIHVVEFEDFEPLVYAERR